jgi:hypothetical protein
VLERTRLERDPDAEVREDITPRALGRGAVDLGYVGVRVKSDTYRGGIVQNLNFHDICTRDIVNR